ncbi:hypothetical protein Vretimale_4933, partial [Volvox reticuliferus]
VPNPDRLLLRREPPPPRPYFQPPNRQSSTTAPQGSAVSRLLADVHHELSTDPFFIIDLLKAAQQVGWEISATVTLRGGSGSGAGDSWLPEELTGLAQQVFEVFREELFPDAAPQRTGDDSKASRPGPVQGSGT